MCPMNYIVWHSFAYASMNDDIPSLTPQWMILSGRRGLSYNMLHSDVQRSDCKLQILFSGINCRLFDPDTASKLAEASTDYLEHKLSKTGEKPRRTTPIKYPLSARQISVHNLFSLLQLSDAEHNPKKLVPFEKCSCVWCNNRGMSRDTLNIAKFPQHSLRQVWMRTWSAAQLYGLRLMSSTTMRWHRVRI